MPTDSPSQCKTVIDSIDEYLDVDRESNADKIKLIDEHLLDCSECNAYVENHRKLLQLTRKAMELDSDDTQVPEGMIESILGKLQKS